MVDQLVCNRRTVLAQFHPALEKRIDEALAKDGRMVSLGYSSGLLLANVFKDSISTIVRLRVDMDSTKPPIPTSKNDYLNYLAFMDQAETAFEEQKRALAGAFSVPQKVVAICLDSVWPEEGRPLGVRKVLDRSGRMELVERLFVARLMEARFEYIVEGRYRYVGDENIGILEKEMFGRGIVNGAG